MGEQKIDTTDVVFAVLVSRYSDVIKMEDYGSRDCKGMCPGKGLPTASLTGLKAGLSARA